MICKDAVLEITTTHLSLSSHKFAGTFFLWFRAAIGIHRGLMAIFPRTGASEGRKANIHKLARSLARAQNRTELATTPTCRPGVGRLSSRFADRRRFGCIWRPDVFLSPRGSAGPAPGSRPVDHLPSDRQPSSGAHHERFCSPPDGKSCGPIIQM